MALTIALPATEGKRRGFQFTARLAKNSLTRQWAHQVENQVIRHPGRTFQVRPRAKSLIGRVRLLQTVHPWLRQALTFRVG